MRAIPANLEGDKDKQGAHAQEVGAHTVGLRQAAVKEPHVLGKGPAHVGLLAWARHVDELRHRQKRHQRVGRRQRADVHAGADLLGQLRRCVATPQRSFAMPHDCSTHANNQGSKAVPVIGVLPTCQYACKYSCFRRPFSARGKSVWEGSKQAMQRRRAPG